MITVAQVTDHPTPLSVALAHAARGRPVAPGCDPDAAGACWCGGTWDGAKGQLVPHEPKAVGKAPIGTLASKGISDATTNTATLDRWWRTRPTANVNIELERSALVVVDTDSAEVEADALSRGLDGGAIRESRNRAYVFKRSAACPVVNLIKADGDPLDILTKGNFVVHGTHRTGCPVRFHPDAELVEEPAWVRELLVRKKAEQDAATAAADQRREERSAQWGGGAEPPVRLHRRGRRRWNGELVEIRGGKLDRDLSLWYIGLDLAECNASEPTIVAALAERDETLGWRKFTDRRDADARYAEIAEKVVASAITHEQAPRLRVVPTPEPATVPDDVAELRAVLEAEQAENARLRRVLIDRDDRLEVLEDLVHTIDDVLGRPDEELSSDDKVVTIAGARWLPYYRSKRLAKEAPPTISLGYLSRVVGMPSRRVSKSLDRQSSDDPNAGAPFRKRVTRTFLDDEQRWESTLEVIPWADRTTETLRAAATYATRARPKRGGSRAAANARWGRCDKHDNREVRVKGYCPDCGAVVGERIVRLAEFDALNVQVGHSGDRAHHGAEGYLVDVQVEHSGPCDVVSGSLNLQPVHSGSPPDELAPRRNGHAPPESPVHGAMPTAWGPPAPAPAKAPPWRCPECRASERKVHPDGSSRCPRGHVSHESAEVAG